jgi:putative transposase
MKFAWIKAHRQEFPVETMCRVLEVSHSGYYAQRKPRSSARFQRQQVLKQKIAQVHAESRGVYGSPRVHRKLLAQGERVCENTVARLMREAQIRAHRRRRFVPRTTDSAHPYPVAGNLLERNFKAERPNQKWTCDITYVPTGEGWLFVAAVLDLYSRKVVGWSMADHLRTELASNALKMALQRRCPGQGLLHHSDRGVQYACNDYQRLLSEHALICSMSRAGNCYDNAVMESFWSSLKTELVYHQRYATREEARRSIFEYLEVFYNRERLHSSIGYLSPEAFEALPN